MPSCINPGCRPARPSTDLARADSVDSALVDGLDGASRARHGGRRRCRPCVVCWPARRCHGCTPCVGQGVEFQVAEMRQWHLGCDNGGTLQDAGGRECTAPLASRCCTYTMNQTPWRAGKLLPCEESPVSAHGSLFLATAGCWLAGPQTLIFKRDEMCQMQSRRHRPRLAQNTFSLGQ